MVFAPKILEKTKDSSMESRKSVRDSLEMTFAYQQEIVLVFAFEPILANPTNPISSKLGSVADIAIIGGGAVGASVAYHLSKRLAGTSKRVVLLEKSRLTSGCTWNAAGLVGQLRGTANLTRMLQQSVALYRNLHRDGFTAGKGQSGGAVLLLSEPVPLKLLAVTIFLKRQLAKR